MKMNGLEHKIVRIFKENGVTDRELILSVSGGQDSIFLLHIVAKISALLHLKLEVLYVHHGLGGDSREQNYRNEAFDFVKSHCETLNLSFASNVEKIDGDVSEVIPTDHFHEAKSESDFRQIREQVYDFLLNRRPKALVVQAHNLEDQLETRLLRMIRGTGVKGLMSMPILSAKKFRPLLQISRTEISQWLNENQVNWLEDPSNAESDYLRNWLRNKWLPQLQERVPGGVKNISLSLGRMTLFQENFADRMTEEVIQEGKLLRPVFASLNLSDKKKALLNFFEGKQIYDYSENHLKEVIKRLDTDRKSLNFRLLCRVWYITPNFVEIRTGNEASTDIGAN